MERRVFPGGCFFTAVLREMQALPEPVRAQIEKHQAGWKRLMLQNAEEAIASGELKTDLKADQLVFEIHALVIMANTTFNAHNDAAVLERAWDGVRRLLGDPGRQRLAAKD